MLLEKRLIFEQTGLDYASTNGFMHACGHDMHTATLLGAAALLKDQENTLPGTVNLFFQAAEETMEGAREAVELGLLDGVDAAAMLHVYSGFPIPSGMISVSGAGSCCASVDWFRIEVSGTGGHGAMPEVTVNPIGIVSAIYQAIQELVSTRVPASQQAVMTVGAVGGGDAANIIPDSAWLSGTIRTFDETQREALKRQLSQAAEGIAKVWGGSAQVSFSSSAPCVVSDGGVSQSALASLRDLLGAEQALDLGVAMGGKFARTMGSEDFAFIAEKVPSVMLRLMAGSQQEGYVFSNHHPQVTYKEDVMPIGAAAYVKVAVDWLEKNRSV